MPIWSAAQVRERELTGRPGGCRSSRGILAKREREAMRPASIGCVPNGKCSTSRPTV